MIIHITSKQVSQFLDETITAFLAIFYPILFLTKTFARHSFPDFFQQFFDDVFQQFYSENVNSFNLLQENYILCLKLVMYSYEHFKAFFYQIGSRKGKKSSKQLGRMNKFLKPQVKTMIVNAIKKILSETKVAMSSIKMSKKI